MNKTNWKAWLEDFGRKCGSYLKDFLKDLGSTVASWLWSAMLAFCIASTITTACESQNAGLLLGLWFLAWIILRLIRYWTVREMDLFAGAVSTTSFQSAFTFILDGIISCFTLGKRMSEGGDISNPIMLIVLGVLWIVMLLVEMAIALVRNHEKAMTAISALEQLSAGLTDEDATRLEIVAQCNDGAKKVFSWVPAENVPTAHDDMDHDEFG